MFRLLLVFSLTAALGTAAAANNIDPQLSQVLSTNRHANVVVSFPQDTRQVLQKVSNSKYATRGAKILSLKTQLEALRDVSQETALHLLKSRGVQYQSMWINNKIFVSNANIDIVNALASLPQVTEIREEVIAHIGDFTAHEVVGVNSSIFAEWAVEKIEAPNAWALPGGNNGAGAVVAIIDTGVRYTHEALQNNYRSSYGWYDPSSGTPNPVDSNGHGTHKMGNLVGSIGIGVAPGAQWIACRGCATSACTEAHLLACGQWLVCPTLPDGTSPDCDMAPSLVSNSWGGAAGSTWYNLVIQAWNAAGIVPFFGIGNSGPGCSSIGSPGDSDGVITVGCTNADDASCGVFAGRGPSPSGSIKPNICAPGTDILSAGHTGDSAYATISGTSNPPPFAAGTAALLFGYDPTFTHQEIKQLLEENADQNLQFPSVPACPDDPPPGTFPNNIFGHGRVNARRSLEAALTFSR